MIVLANMILQMYLIIFSKYNVRYIIKLVFLAVPSARCKFLINTWVVLNARKTSEQPASFFMLAVIRHTLFHQYDDAVFKIIAHTETLTFGCLVLVERDC